MSINTGLFGEKLRVYTLLDHHGFFIKQLPQGIALLNEDNSDDNTIYYFSKKINVTDSRIHFPDSGSGLKQKRNNFRQNKKIWRLLFSCEDDLVYESHGAAIKSLFLPCVDTFSTQMVSDEIYFPVAFLKNNNLVGGAYINLWVSKKNNCVIEASHYIPVDAFHTGGCMFGGSLYGVDCNNHKYSLTDPKAKITETCKINKIQNDYELHPDELLSRQSLINLIPWFKSLSKTNKPVIYYQIPLPNYIIYGISQYFKGILSKKALVEYVRIIKWRAKQHETELRMIAGQYDCDIRFVTTLKCLNLDQFNEETLIENLLELIGLNISHHADQIPLLFYSIINYLSSKHDYIGEIWSIVKESDKDLFSFNRSDLLQLNYIDYSATLALCKKYENEKNICSVMPSHEKHIALRYKNIFSEKFGGVLCASYLPAFHVSISRYNHSVFYLTNYIDEVNALLKTDLIKNLSFKTASIALQSF